MSRYTRARCFHEAGYAIARLVIGRKARRVSVREQRFEPAADRLIRLRGQYDVWDEVLLIFAGPFAEARVRHCGVSALLRGIRHDSYLQAERWLRWLIDHGFADDLHAARLRAEAESRLFLRTHWRTIESVADLLGARGALEADEVSEIFRASATTTDRW